jgi:hypothetical protein
LTLRNNRERDRCVASDRAGESSHHLLQCQTAQFSKCRGDQNLYRRMKTDRETGHEVDFMN